MSVLIKGMEMPENCHICVAGYGGCCFVAPAEEDGVCSDHGRAEWCPLEEAEPVVHGHWRGEYDGYADGNPCYDMWFCSECDYCVEDDSCPDYNYCPNCGAKMDEVSE